MSHHCTECDVNWWPYQTRAGRCPQCGGGTRRSHESPSEAATLRHQASIAESKRTVSQRRFEAYYAERAQGKDAA